MALDLKDERLSIGDTREFIQKMNRMMAELESHSVLLNEKQEQAISLATQANESAVQTQDDRNFVQGLRDEVVPKAEAAVAANTEAQQAKEQAVTAASSALTGARAVTENVEIAVNAAGRATEAETTSSEHMVAAQTAGNRAEQAANGVDMPPITPADHGKALRAGANGKFTYQQYGEVPELRGEILLGLWDD